MEGEEDPSVELPPSSTFPEPPKMDYVRPSLKKGMYAQSPDVARREGESSKGVNSAAQLGAGLSAGITFTSSVVVSVLLGMWLDKKFEPHAVPWATIALTILGFVAGLVNFIRISAATDTNKGGR
jgi:F0F1-type ATP synthase assembly protein I